LWYYTVVMLVRHFFKKLILTLSSVKSCWWKLHPVCCSQWTEGIFTGVWSLSNRFSTKYLLAVKFEVSMEFQKRRNRLY